MTPILLRGVRTKHDNIRNQPVLLGPERALVLDQIGAAILSEVDGTRTLDQIVNVLASKFDAPKEAIHGDVSEFLINLADKRLLEMRE